MLDTGFWHLIFDWLLSSILDLVSCLYFYLPLHIKNSFTTHANTLFI